MTAQYLMLELQAQVV